VLAYQAAADMTTGNNNAAVDRSTTASAV